MYFLLGIIVGILLSTLVIVILIFFKEPVERNYGIMQRKIEQAGPNLKGHIYLPEDDGTVARKEIIKKNKEAGKDTPLSELE